MTVLPFIQKENGGLPDSYGAKIFYVTGKQDEFELASHTLIQATGMIELVTEDDRFHLIPFSSIQRLEFDKRFSKIVALKQQETKKA